MYVNPSLRLVFLVLMILILFFFAVTYINILASKSVQLSDMQSSINTELTSRGDNQERISQELNKEVRTLTRSERINRVGPDSTLKIKDIAPSVSHPAQATPPAQTDTSRDPSIVIR